MSAHATLPIERRSADVRRTDRRVPAGRTGNPGRLHSDASLRCRAHRMLPPKPSIVTPAASRSRHPYVTGLMS